MDTIIQKLNDGFPVLADGAMGTLLQQWGHGDVQCLEMLNIDNPEVIAEVARKYLEAGAEIIQTNTFGCSPIKLAEKGLSEKYREISVKAVDIIQQVVGDRAWIAGDYGSCGVSLQPFGDLEIEDYKDSCRKQFLALAEAGVDAFSIETMMDLREGVLRLRWRGKWRRTCSSWRARPSTRLPLVISRLMVRKWSKLLGVIATLARMRSVQIAVWVLT